MAIEDFRGDYRWLSNYHLCEVEFDTLTYPSTEHAYQAAKSMLPAEIRAIREAKTPGDAKRLGQKVCMRPDWEDVKIDIMRDLLRQKFKHPELREKLLATGRQHLVEGNTWGDEFWGVHQGNGLNHLGRLLMDVRAEIQRSTRGS
jgi:N-glycosidase YbiA